MRGKRYGETIVFIKKKGQDFNSFIGGQLSGILLGLSKKKKVLKMQSHGTAYDFYARRALFEM